MSFISRVRRVPRGIQPVAGGRADTKGRRRCLGGGWTAAAGSPRGCSAKSRPRSARSRWKVCMNSPENLEGESNTSDCCPGTLTVPEKSRQSPPGRGRLSAGRFEAQFCRIRTLSYMSKFMWLEYTDCKICRKLTGLTGQ